MSKLKALETKKLLKELEFVESDYDYKAEVIGEADSDFLKSVNTFLETKPELKDIFDRRINYKVDQMLKKKQDEIREIEINEAKADREDEILEVDQTQPVEEEPCQEDETIENIDATKLKKLYREIVKLTHPDKVANKKFNDLYIRGTSFYDKNDIAGLYSICDELNIEYEVDEADNQLISDKIGTLKERIGFMQSTYTWKWFYSKDQQEKDNVVVAYIRMQLQ